MGSNGVEIQPHVVTVSRRHFFLFEDVFDGFFVVVVDLFVVAVGEALLAGLLDGLGAAGARPLLPLHLGVFAGAVEVGSAGAIALFVALAGLVSALLRAVFLLSLLAALLVALLTALPLLCAFLALRLLAFGAAEVLVDLVGALVVADALLFLFALASLGVFLEAFTGFVELLLGFLALLVLVEFPQLIRGVADFGFFALAVFLLAVLLDRKSVV